MGCYSQPLRFLMLPVIFLLILFSSIHRRHITNPTKRKGSNPTNKNFVLLEVVNKNEFTDGNTVDLMNTVAKKQGLKIQ